MYMYTQQKPQFPADFGPQLCIHIPRIGITKCDEDSWCSGLRDDNLTMTRESWHSGTYSHEWGTSAIVGVVWGVMGVHQTSPAWGSFTMKPKLGSLTVRFLLIVTVVRLFCDSFWSL